MAPKVGGLEKAKHLSSDAVLVRPLPESYISTQICDLCNDFKLYYRFYLKQIRIACTYISVVIDILLFFIKTRVLACVSLLC